MEYKQTNSWTGNGNTIFLNPLEHAGKTYIKLWNKPNRQISEKLKAAAGVKFSKTYKCYVMAHSEHQVALLQQHLDGTAQVNTQYLNRRKRLRPAKTVCVSLGKTEFAELAKLPDLPVVRLLPLIFNQREVLQISFAYDSGIYNRLLQGSRVKWLTAPKCFVTGPDSTSLHQLLD